MSLESSPLVNANQNGPFTAHYNTKEIAFDSDGIQSISYAGDTEPCFTQGLINDFLTLEVKSAYLRLGERMVTNVPLLPAETNAFYGFEITGASVVFTVDSTEIEATGDRILAAEKFVAGRIYIEGNPTGDDQFKLKNNEQSISVEKLHKTLEQHGFYRIKITPTDDRLWMEFYTEK